MIDYYLPPEKYKYINIVNIIELEFGEIGDLLIEDNTISFNVYKDYYDNPTKEIKINKNTKLILIDKFDDPFYSLCYEIKKVFSIQNIYRTISNIFKRCN